MQTLENKPQPMANKRGIISIVLTVIAALAVFLAPQISNIVEGVMDVLSSDEGVTVGGTSDNAQVSEQAEMINYETLAETDILGITTPCTAYARMEISGEDIAFMCQAFLETHYPDNVPEIKKDFNGYKINDGSGEIMYENEYSARLNNGMSEYIAVGADAVTGSARYINIQMADKELIREFLEVFLTNLSGISGVTADDLNLLFLKPMISVLAVEAAEIMGSMYITDPRKLCIPSASNIMPTHGNPAYCWKNRR